MQQHTQHAFGIKRMRLASDNTFVLLFFPFFTPCDFKEEEHEEQECQQQLARENAKANRRGRVVLADSEDEEDD